MEDSGTKKSGGVLIPKKKWSLDLKSLYESRLSEVGGGSEKNDSGENEQVDVKKKKRKSRKEVTLSSLESDANKRRKGDGNGAKSDIGFREKLDGWSKELHGISLSFGNDGSSFKIPKRPRGSVGRKNLEGDQGDSEPLGLSNSVDCVGSVKADVSKSKDKGGPRDQLVNPVAFHAAKDGVSKSRLAGKLVGSKKLSKPNAGSKSTGNSGGSGVNFKKKVGADEPADRVREYEADINSSKCKAGKVVGLNKKPKGKADTKSPMNTSSSDVKLKKKVAADEAEINSSDHKGGPNDQSVTGKDEAGKVVGSNKKSKRKTDPKSTTNLSNSNLKLKTKMGTDEVVDCVGAFEAEDKGSPNNRSDSPSTISASDEEARKVIGLKKKTIRNVKPRSTMNSTSPNLKLKAGTDEAVDHLGADEVTESDDKGCPNDQSDKLVTLASGKDGFSNSKLAKTNVGSNSKYKRKADPKTTTSPSNSNKKLKVGADDAVVLVRPVSLSAVKGGISNSRLAGKLDGSGTKSKRKADVKSTLNSSSSSTKLKQKLVSDKGKSKTDGQSDSVSYVVKESNPVVNNGDVPPKKRQGKKKDSVIGRNGVKTSIKKSEPAVARPVSDSPFIDSLDEDDDDLEQNAARMLSSRFDPSCTGFKSKKKPSVSQRVDDLSLPVSSDWDSTRRVKPFGGGESDFGDDNNRKLRPRGGDKGKGVLRKRRHFYEIPTGDLDPIWFLKRKIKIFWPLDKCWYFGHLTDYHSEAKLHHLKYDDGEEEWVNLEEENFRLLLHHFEVPGKEKSRKQSTVVKDATQKEETVPPADNDNCIGSDPDSEPIASWMASLSQSSKELSSVKTDNSNGNVNTSKLYRKKPQPLKNGKHAVYVRKKGSSSLSRGAKARGSAPWAVTLLSADVISLPTTNGDKIAYDCVEGYHNQLWPTFNNLLLESKEFKIQICLPLLPYLEYLCGVGSFGILHDIFMLHHGVIITTSSAIFLEMLVIDSNRGMRSVLFEGFLMQALAIVFRILTVFSYFDERCNGELKVPLTSIRFQLSNVNDLRKQHVFEAYCFSKLPSSEWLYLETNIMEQCRLIKQLSSSECTYGNIRELESGRIVQPCKSLVASELSSREDLRKKFRQVLLPTGQSNFSLTGKPEDVPRKPRTQVHYTLPFSGHDISTKPETSSPRSIHCKRIRRASLKKITDNSGNNQKKLESLTCLANVLVTHGEKGWRESGAHIVLESSDHNEWRLAVKLSGVTKFSYKVTHILEPGSTNRYSHAVIWKGGKDWMLEFQDRSQWLLFKDIYEECYNQNIRAASVKNIPIPGVRPVVEGGEYGEEVPFVRNSMMYFQQVQTDAEMAMDPSRILYDMDSDDEQWLVTHKDCNDKNMHEEITDEFFEMAMNMFEKVSYAQRRENLTDAEIEELAIVIGSVEAAKLIYIHWRQKREKMCMPLIRHLQPPPWQRYQKQMKEWEHSIARSSQEKLPPPEKPPMFAFCFKPRGLDVPNKPSKQRSYRRLSVPGLNLASSADHSLLASGRRSNMHVYGDEKALYASTIHDEWKVNNNNNRRKAHKNKRKKLDSCQRTIGEGTNGVQQWNVGPPEMSGQSHYYCEGPISQGGGGSRQPDFLDLPEFQAHEALGASRNAIARARLKRDRAQRKFCKADHMIHKAVSILMQAEAMQEPLEVSNGVVS